NYGVPGKGPLLEEGMVLAVEPMMTAGRAAVRVGGDGWAIFSQDGSPAAHFEYTVAITGEGPRVLTPWRGPGAPARSRAAEELARPGGGLGPRGEGPLATPGSRSRRGLAGPCGGGGRGAGVAKIGSSARRRRFLPRTRASPRGGSGGRSGRQSRLA